MKQPLVVVDDSVIQRLLANPQAVAALPFLKDVQQSARAAHCSSCDPANVDYAAVKNSLAALDSAGLRALKTILNAERIRFFRPTRHQNRPVVVKHTR